MPRAGNLAQTLSPGNLTLLDFRPGGDALTAEVVAGLSARPKRLPPKLFYDARGARLFTRICTTAAYYPTRAEASILRERAGDIARAVGPGASVIEPGAGDMRKIRYLLPALRPRAYIAIDISIEQLREEAAALAREFPRLAVTGICAEFDAAQVVEVLVREPGRRILFFPGSTIGNFEPGDAAGFLQRAAQLVGPSGGALIGVDLVKSKPILDLAYNDPEGYTAQFNLNLLDRLNREMGATFDTWAFAHRAFFNQARSRIEMHLVSLKRQTVTVGPQSFEFDAGETIHTENSYKYTREHFVEMSREAGFEAAQSWTDVDRRFALFFLSNA
jgi:L-histidine Nalpha-methyltransferase